MNSAETRTNKIPRRDSDRPSALPERWLVVITCKDEADQITFLREMESTGREYKAIVG